MVPLQLNGPEAPARAEAGRSVTHHPASLLSLPQVLMGSIAMRRTKDQQVWGRAAWSGLCGVLRVWGGGAETVA